MSRVLVCVVILVACMNGFAQQTLPATAGDDGWISLFDGTSLDGWRANEHTKTFQLRDGMIVAHGKRCHLFYVGRVNNAKFTNFELKLDIKTEKGANSGVYFHTAWQKKGWPAQGYEVQVNNSHSDWRRTGSLYAVVDVRDSAAKDDEWFTETISVRGKQIMVRVNDKIVVQYTEPETVDYPGMPGRRLSSGTFCLQGHDPQSVVYYKNIFVKPLP